MATANDAAKRSYLAYWLLLFHRAEEFVVHAIGLRPEGNPKRKTSAFTRFNVKRGEYEFPHKFAQWGSRVVFGWFSPLVQAGRSRPIDADDVWQLEWRLGAQSAHEAWYKCWADERTRLEELHKDKAESVPSMYRVLYQANRPEVRWLCVVRLANEVLWLARPLVLGWLISGMQSGDAATLATCVLLLTCLTALIAVANEHYWFAYNRFATRVKAGLTCAVFTKVMCMSSTSRHDKSIGNMSGMLTGDIFHATWIAKWLDFIIFIFRIMFNMALLWYQLGTSAVFGLAVILAVIPINYSVTRIIKRLQRDQVRYKRQRLQLLTDILLGIRVVKMYAWEDGMQRMIQKIRAQEVNVGKRKEQLQVIWQLTRNWTPFLVALSALGGHSLLGNELTPLKTVFSLALFASLRFAAVHLAEIAEQISHCGVSLARLRRLLNAPELDRYSSEKAKQFAEKMKDKCETDWLFSSKAAKLLDAEFAWRRDAPKATLRSLNVRVPKGRLTAVVGPVGSGKSSLIAAILGEMELLTGERLVTGSVAYVEQQPWIQNASFRNNVLFGKDFDEPFYTRVVDACALRPDLALLADDDQTEIGEKGVNLSGGQKARLSLARAVYQDCAVYYLDDPLSAVDAHVGIQIFDGVLGRNGLLKHKTRLLATNCLQYLPQADEILVIADGCITARGTYEELKENSQYFGELIDTYAKEADNKPERASDTVTSVAELSKSKSRERSPTKLIEEEVNAVGKVGIEVYLGYFKAIGVHICVGFFCISLLGAAFDMAANFWLAKWSERGAHDPLFPRVDVKYEWLCVYGLLGFGQAACITAAGLLLPVGTMRASVAAEAAMFRSVVGAPVGFFERTPIGRLLNRFDGVRRLGQRGATPPTLEDLSAVDSWLVRNMQQWLSSVISAASVFVYILVAHPSMIAVLAPAIFGYVVLFRLHIGTFRQLRRLERSSRSKLYSAFEDMASGGPTIRAFCKERRFLNACQDRVNDHNRFAIAKEYTNWWLGIRMGLLDAVTLFLTSICSVLSISLFGGAAPIGVTGLALTNMFRLSGAVGFAVRKTGEIETNIVSYERVREYTEIESEEASKARQWSRVNEDWPNKGKVELRNFSTKYRPDLDTVLKNVSAVITPRQRIGIVGRTGAGKSSLALSLFGFLDATEGKILIDNQSVATVRPCDLRRRLAIIPQDPWLFSGSLRANLDPFGVHADERLWQALRHAHLAAAVEALPNRLDEPIARAGTNLSVGQRQLVCLARALLRDARVLLLDEATASVDVETDARIQQTVRSHCAGATTLLIAHRLNTVLDCDKIMLLEDGRLVEFDDPRVLMKDKQSKLFALASAAGCNTELERDISIPA